MGSKRLIGPTDRGAGAKAFAEVVDLKLKVEAQSQELAKLSQSIVTKEELVEQFGKHNKAINELFAKYDTEVRAYITDQIVEGVKIGIQEYDKAAKANFVTRGDLAASGAVDPTTGTPIARGMQQGGQGGGFLEMVGKLVFNAISNPGSGGQDVFAVEFSKYRNLFERRMQLEWSSFLKERFGPLPSAAEEGTGHVEVSG